MKIYKKIFAKRPLIYFFCIFAADFIVMSNLHLQYRSYTPSRRKNKVVLKSARPRASSSPTGKRRRYVRNLKKSIF